MAEEEPPVITSVYNPPSEASHLRVPPCPRLLGSRLTCPCGAPPRPSAPDVTACRYPPKMRPHP
eukprot:gene9046-1624_t